MFERSESIMTPLPEDALHLTTRWVVRPDRLAQVEQALAALVAAVHAHEPDTLVYMVHRPADGHGHASLPTVDSHTVLFFEVYRNTDAFRHHVTGPIFTRFVEEHGDDFVADTTQPCTFVEFLRIQYGFIRSADSPAIDATDHCHPAVIFEILAKDQAKLLGFYRHVFGWDYEQGTGGFAYVRFPMHTLALLGAASAQTRTAAERSFYLRVDDLELAIARVQAAGGRSFVAPVHIDGYAFAMVKDPEGNVVGLIRPFDA
jgi:predicted enzyme related to lactoylglutathione lyase/quinol monooxygenase YgiN